MIPTARCMAAKPAGFFKRSADEIGRLSKIGAESLPLRVYACLRLLTRWCFLQLGILKVFIRLRSLMF